MQTTTTIPYDPSAAVTDFANQWHADDPIASLNFYILVDPAQDETAWRQLTAHSRSSRAILSSNAANLTPHLLDCGSATEITPALAKTLARKYRAAAFTMICSASPMAALHAHLHQLTAVHLPGDYEMGLAFWDPAILGTLVGQTDDDTLHVRGPVLTSDQRHMFLSPIAAWWYRDREDHWHRIEETPPDTAIDPETDVLPLTLDQRQEDALVDASVPDQILSHLEENRQTLFDRNLPAAKRYRFVRAVLPSARKLGLTGMRDLTSFVALCLIYRQRIGTDPQILHLLDAVQKKAMTLDDAMALMPE